VNSSLNRRLIERELERRNTTLADFIGSGQTSGRSMEDIWLDLRNLTGIPFSVRTLYRWADSLEKVAS
jgi:hypothetical protein